MSSPPPPIDIPSLLRFLTQTASVPLAIAISTIPLLKAASLTSPTLIAAAPAAAIKNIFPDDEKRAKAVHAAAKREVKKRKASDAAETPAGKKARRGGGDAGEGTRDVDREEQMEADLALPTIPEHFPHLTSPSTIPSTELLTHLATTTLYTNRAPLLLAFALTLLAYSMPEQPLSSRLSLAQAVVSEGARKRARELGIDSSAGGAEREGWGDGRPAVKVMGRLVKVMRRGVPADARGDTSEGGEMAGGNQATSGVKAETAEKPQEAEAEAEGVWALDLEALKKANMNMLPSPASKTNVVASLPVYHPQGARAYLMKSFASASAPKESTTGDTSSEKVEADAEADAGAEADAVALSTTPPSPPTNKTTKAAKSTKPRTPKASKAHKPPSLAQQKAANLALLLTALDIVFASWAEVLGADELDRRAWGWYVSVRPSVEEGAAGWGGKGEVDLKRVIGLRRVVKKEEVEEG